MIGEISDLSLLKFAGVNDNWKLVVLSNQEQQTQLSLGDKDWSQEGVYTAQPKRTFFQSMASE